MRFWFRAASLFVVDTYGCCCDLSLSIELELPFGLSRVLIFSSITLLLIRSVADGYRKALRGCFLFLSRLDGSPVRSVSEP